jgi:hypothetical protein
MNTTALSDKKRNAILQLIYTNTECREEREQWLDHLESTSCDDDSDEILKILSNYQR